MRVQPRWMTLACFMVCICVDLTHAQLFTYGSPQHWTVPRYDDGNSNGATINIKYYGNIETRIYVGTNGVVTFRSGTGSLWSPPFPAHPRPVIAPWWTDIDPRSHGVIYEGHATEDNLSEMVDALVDYDPLMAAFSPTSGYIVTFYQVPAYYGQATSARNTFQVALVTDDVFSFVILNYVDMAWNGGMVGFDKGDYATAYTLTSSGITSIATQSNCGVPGRYMFRADTIVQPIGEAVIDYCEVLDCTFRGTCADGTCTCEPGYEGDNCELVLCLGLPGELCANDGVCGASGCDCESPWYGNNCTHDNAHCTDVDCAHGICGANEYGDWEVHENSDCGGNDLGRQAISTAEECMQHCYSQYSNDGCVAAVFGYSSVRGYECYPKSACSTFGPLQNYHIHKRVYGHCTCDDEYTYSVGGTACDAHICGPVDCMNGGTCLNNGTGTCLCRLGWAGEDCSEDDACGNVTCNGHGACVIVDDSPTCRCDDMSFGPDHGELSNQCSQQTCDNGLICDNGGLCNDADGCDCPYPYNGTNCTSYDDFCSQIDCVFGDCSTDCDPGTAYIADIPDSALTGSSQYNSGHGWQRSRLNTVAGAFSGAWSSGSNSVGQYIQADLGTIRTLSAIATQGRNAVAQWVSSYQFSFSLNGSTYDYISNADGSPTNFEGNSDSDTIVEHEIIAIYARYIRLYPQTWQGHISMRWEVYSCAAVGYSCTCNGSQYLPDPVTGLCTTTICTNNTHICRNTGICNSTGCDCPFGYIGDNCETWDACADVTCENNGVCFDSQHNGGDYKCMCTQGFHGRHCELQRSMDEITCYNGGRVTSEGCRCPVEWSGEDCRTVVSSVCIVDSESYDCGVGGTCSGADSPICTCDSGYSQTSPSAPCTLDCGDLQCSNGGQCSDDETHCQCQPGWYGRDACDMADSCADIECHQWRGSCCGNSESPACECILSIYGGDDCSTEFCDATYPQTQCLNGGTCTQTGCDCAYPYEGDTCDVANYCPADYCVHGTCSTNVNGDGAVCACDTGYITSQDTRLCTTQYLCDDHYSMCLNGGSCRDDFDHCDCIEGFSGTYCQTFDLCANHECLHGICVADITTNSHSCSCEQEWMGKQCDMQSCSADLMCSNGDLCSRDGCMCETGWTGSDCSVALDTGCYTGTENIECGHGSCNDGVCVCDTGYTRGTSGSCHVEADSCGSYSCNNGATCEDGTCVCPPGYDGPDCSDIGCLDMDCGQNGKCHLMDDGSHRCVCHDPRWTGDDCATETCSDDTTCLNGGQCTNDPESGQCMCAAGYSGTDCGTVEVCANLDCRNGGVCVALGDDYMCRCADGFRIDAATGLCTIAQCDNCLHICMNGNSCDGPSACACADGATGDSCETVAYCFSETCSDHGQCREAMDAHGNSLHEAQCVCDSGFHGETCQYQRSPDGVVCFNGGLSTMFGCECASGWGGPSCEVSYTRDCLLLDCENGVCADGVCSCDDGWTGSDCNNRECGSLECQNGGTCYEDDVETMCFCAQGFTGTECSQSDPCVSIATCYVRGECVVAGSDVSCLCDDASRYSGNSCQIEHCASTNIDCQNGGSCTAFSTCECTQSYSGDTCETYDPCHRNPCLHGECSENADGFECTCDASYTVGITGLCDTMWCTTHDTFCMNGGQCVSRDSYSECLCPPGVSGDNCETVDHCYNQDCNNHGICQNDVRGGSYICHCDEGWLGHQCDIQRCGDAVCVNNGVCESDECSCASAWSGASCDVTVSVGCREMECDHGTCMSDQTGCETPTPIINSANLEASSELDSDYSAQFGSGSWMPASSDASPWIAAEFEQTMTVDDIGVEYMSGEITAYLVQYRIDSTDLEWVRDSVTNAYHVFTADNAEHVQSMASRTVMLHSLSVPILATYVRIRVHRWTDEVNMRFELYGCIYETYGVCICEEDYAQDSDGVCTVDIQALIADAEESGGDSSGGLSPWVLAAAILGGAIILAAIIVFIAMLVKKSTSAAPSSASSSNADDMTVEDLDTVPNSTAPSSTSWA